MQGLAQDGRRGDRGHGRDDEEQGADGARGVRPEEVDEEQQRDDAHPPRQPSEREQQPRADVEAAAEHGDGGGHEDGAGDRLHGGRDADVGAAGPMLLHDGPAGEAEHPDQRHADADTDAGVAELGREADRDPDDADRQAGPEARVAAFVAGAHGDRGGDERREAEHRERGERRRDAEREAAVHAAELDDLEQDADDREAAERGAAPAAVAQRERDREQRGEQEARGEQRQRVRDVDRDGPDDVAGAPEDDEGRKQRAIGHSSSVPVAGHGTNRT